MVSKRNATEAQNSSLPKSFQEMVHMLKSFRKSLIVSFEKITVLTVIFSLMGGGAAFAAAGGFPGRPTPPPPPCISTGFLAENGFEAGGCYFCNVRNVGVTSHTVAVEVRDQLNFIEGGTIPQPLAAGQGIIVSSCPPANQTSSDACVVTTDEGTTDALGDLAVVLQFSTPAGETEGKIFNSCAASRGVVNNP